MFPNICCDRYLLVGIPNFEAFNDDFRTANLLKIRREKLFIKVKCNACHVIRALCTTTDLCIGSTAIIKQFQCLSIHDASFEKNAAHCKIPIEF